jgi:hypothetical protein
MRCYYGDDIEDNRRWEGNIKMDLKEIGVDVMNWKELAQYIDHWRALVNELVNIPISSQLCYVTMETI